MLLFKFARAAAVRKEKAILEEDGRNTKRVNQRLPILIAKMALSFDWFGWNEPAIEFYKSLGAEIMKEWLTMRVDGEALKKLARMAKV